MSKILQPNGIIVSPGGPDLTVTITVDTKTNSTMMTTNRPFNRFVLIGVLQEHALSLVKQLMVESTVGVAEQKRVDAIDLNKKTDKKVD